MTADQSLKSARQGQAPHKCRRRYLLDGPVPSTPRQQPQPLNQRRRRRQGPAQMPRLAGATDSILGALSLQATDLFADKDEPDEPEVFYVYEDENGNPLHRTVRKARRRGEKKGFYQQNWDGHQWVKGLGARRVLYRLPQVLAGSRTRRHHLRRRRRRRPQRRKGRRNRNMQPDGRRHMAIRVRRVPQRRQCHHRR